jgi:hypothetical protein
VNAFVADSLPGEDAAKRADLVICNGGSGTTHQALASGTSVLGIASSMDQLLNMQSICSAGAGEVLRAGHADARRIRTYATTLLSQPTYAEATQALATIFAKYDAPSRFREILDGVLPPLPLLTQEGERGKTLGRCRPIWIAANGTSLSFGPAWAGQRWAMRSPRFCCKKDLSSMVPGFMVALNFPPIH